LWSVERGEKKKASFSSPKKNRDKVGVREKMGGGQLGRGGRGRGEPSVFHKASYLWVGGN